MRIRPNVHRAIPIAALLTAGLLLVMASPAAAGTPVRVGVYDNPPFTAVDGSNVSGIISDVVDEVAAEHDWDVEYVVATWPEQLKNLESGSITVLAPVAWTSPRAETYAFSSITVLGNWGVLAVPTGRAPDYDELTDLKGVRIAALKGDVYLESSTGLRSTLAQAGIAADIIEYESYEDVLAATADGDADVGLVHRLAIPTLGSRSGLDIATLVVCPISLRFAGPLDDPETVQALIDIDTTLLRLQQEPGSAYYDSIDRNLGTYGALQTGWPDWVPPTLLGVIGLVVVLSTLAVAQRMLVRSRTKELDESLDRFRALFDAIPDAIFVLNGRGRIVDFKPATDWPPAAPPEVFLGKFFTDFPFPPDLIAVFSNAIAKVLETGVTQSIPYTLSNPMPDGPLGHYEGRFTRAGDEEILLIVRDITERQLTEQAERERAIELEQAVTLRTNELVETNLELAAASQAKSVFLANMSHELRTPLNSVIGFSGTMLQGLAGDVTDEQERQLTMINTSGRHLLSLVNDVLDLSRVESGRTDPKSEIVDLNGLVAEAAGTIESRARTKNIYVKVESADLGMLRTDRRMLLQILINLLNNAVKFTTTGGITVSAECDTASVRISVTDTGPGIPNDQIPHAFQDFYQISQPATAKSSGFGLGLPISLRLANMLGGTLTATSEVGSGSTFTVWVPALDDTPPS